MIGWILLIAVLGFMAGVVYTFVEVSQSVGSSDNKHEMSKAISTVALVNSVLTIILFGVGLAYVNAYPNAARIYYMFIAHAAILLSIISVSVTALQKLDMASAA